MLLLVIYFSLYSPWPTVLINVIGVLHGLGERTQKHHHHVWTWPGTIQVSRPRVHARILVIIILSRIRAHSCIIYTYRNIHLPNGSWAICLTEFGAVNGRPVGRNEQGEVRGRALLPSRLFGCCRVCSGQRPLRCAREFTVEYYSHLCMRTMRHRTICVCAGDWPSGLVLGPPGPGFWNPGDSRLLYHIIYGAEGWSDVELLTALHR